LAGEKYESATNQKHTENRKENNHPFPDGTGWHENRNKQQGFFRISGTGPDKKCGKSIYNNLQAHSQ
jgi:hypothetical protein